MQADEFRMERVCWMESIQKKRSVYVCERQWDRQTDRVCGEGEKMQKGKQPGYKMLKYESG